MQGKTIILMKMRFLVISVVQYDVSSSNLVVGVWLYMDIRFLCQQKDNFKEYTFCCFLLYLLNGDHLSMKNSSLGFFFFPVTLQHHDKTIVENHHTWPYLAFTYTTSFHNCVLWMFYDLSLDPNNIAMVSYINAIGLVYI